MLNLFLERLSEFRGSVEGYIRIQHVWVHSWARCFGWILDAEVGIVYFRSFTFFPLNVLNRVWRLVELLWLDNFIGAWTKSKQNSLFSGVLRTKKKAIWHPAAISFILSRQNEINRTIFGFISNRLEKCF